MATCTLNGGIDTLNSCRTAGGINSVYIVASTDPYYSDTTIDGLLVGIADGGAVTLHKWELPLNTGVASENLTSDYTSGTFDIKQGVTLNTISISTDRIATFQSLIASVAMLVHYNNGITRLFGKDYFLEPDTLDINSGASQSDATTVSLAFSGSEVEFAPILRGSDVGNPLGTLSEGTDYNLITE